MLPKQTQETAKKSSIRVSAENSQAADSDDMSSREKESGSDAESDDIGSSNNSFSDSKHHTKNTGES